MAELAVGLTFTESQVPIDGDKVRRLHGIVGIAAETSTAIPTYANLALSGVARQLADSGAVPNHGVVHTAEATKVAKPLSPGSLVDAALQITKVRERAGVVQFETTGTLTAHGETVAVVTSTLTYRPESGQ